MAADTTTVRYVAESTTVMAAAATTVLRTVDASTVVATASTGPAGANGAAGAQGATGAQGDSGARARQHAFVSTGYGTDYFGSAPLGTATTTALWTIKKIVLDGSGAATVTTATNVRWVDYLTATYT